VDYQISSILNIDLHINKHKTIILICIGLKNSLFSENQEFDPFWGDQLVLVGKTTMFLSLEGNAFSSSWSEPIPPGLPLQDTVSGP
jgi:hypothetical protein